VVGTWAHPINRRGLEVHRHVLSLEVGGFWRLVCIVEHGSVCVGHE